jgi:hypothetical protein
MLKCFLAHRVLRQIGEVGVGGDRQGMWSELGHQPPIWTVHKVTCTELKQHFSDLLVALRCADHSDEDK